MTSQKIENITVSNHDGFSRNLKTSEPIKPEPYQGKLVVRKNKKSNQFNLDSVSFNAASITSSAMPMPLQTHAKMKGGITSNVRKMNATMSVFRQHREETNRLMEQNNNKQMSPRVR